MQLHTSFYGNLKNVPADHFIIFVSGGLTPGLEEKCDVWDKNLAPSKSIFFDYKEDGNIVKYVERFKKERLSQIDWLERLEYYEEEANRLGKSLDNIVFFCYEAAGSDDGKGHFCHRHILAESLENEFKTKVVEHGFEDCIRDNYKLKQPISADFLF